MGVMGKIQGVLVGSEAKKYSYRCGDCDAEFATHNHDLKSVECPECGVEVIKSKKKVIPIR